MRSLLLLSLVLAVFTLPQSANAGLFGSLIKDRNDEPSISSYDDGSSSWGRRFRSSNKSKDRNTYRSSRSLWNKNGSSNVSSGSQPNDRFSLHSVPRPSELQSIYSRALTNTSSRIEIASCNSTESTAKKEQMKSFLSGNFEMLERLVQQYNDYYDKRDVQSLIYTRKHFNELLSHIEIHLLNYERDQQASCSENPYTCNLIDNNPWPSSLANEFPMARDFRMPDELIEPSSLQTTCRRTEALSRKRIAAPICNTPQALMNLEQIREYVEAALGELSLLAMDYTNKYQRTSKDELQNISDRFFALKSKIEEKIRLYEKDTTASCLSLRNRCDTYQPSSADESAPLPSMDLLNIASEN